MDFSELGLSPTFVDRLTKEGIKEPTSIQGEVFKPVHSGQSVLGLSKTGTGKTFAFLAPLVQRFSETPAADGGSCIRGVVLIPTRELATQVARDLEILAQDSQRGTVIIGGEAEDRQIQDSRSTTWLIATPGRLLDLLKRKLIDVSRAEAIVFDEADRLLDMGFIDDIRALMKFMPRSVQMLFFSATLHFGVDEMAYEFGAECFRFGQEEKQLTVEGLDHQVAFVGDQEKFHALVWYIAQQGKARGIVFSNYRDRAHEISSRLLGLGCESECLTAQLSQGARTRIMEDFRAGKVQVLTASDVAARGLDVFDIDYVVNVDLPEDPAIYVHRVGRTARAGRKGHALSFVGFEDSFRLDRLEKFLGKTIERFQFPLEALQGPLHRFKPEPPRMHQPRRDSAPAASANMNAAKGPVPTRTQAPSHPPRVRADHTPKLDTKTRSPAKALSLGQRVLNFFANIFGAKRAKPESTVVARGSATVTASAAPADRQSRAGGHHRGGGGGRSRSGGGGRGRGGSSSRSSSTPGRAPSSSRGRR